MCCDVVMFVVLLWGRWEEDIKSLGKDDKLWPQHVTFTNVPSSIAFGGSMDHESVNEYNNHQSTSTRSSAIQDSTSNSHLIVVRLRWTGKNPIIQSMANMSVNTMMSLPSFSLNDHAFQSWRHAWLCHSWSFIANINSISDSLINYMRSLEFPPSSTISYVDLAINRAFTTINNPPIHNR